MGADDSFNTTTTTTTTRLHITPLDPDLLKVVIPAKVLPSAANISYHTLETFPEKRYGFVDLPTDEADKIKKKLNGAVLRGVKICIEQARPSGESLAMARRRDEQAAEQPPARATKKDRAPREKKDRSKKRKRDDEEIVGVELEEGRKVKRGWTVTPEEAREAKIKEKVDKKKDSSKKKDAKDGKKKKRREQKSLYTDGPECLVRAVLPATAASTAADGSAKKKAKDKTVVVHEFKKTKTFPTFLKSSAAQSQGTTTEFVEGVGWVDEDGNVVEAVRSTRPTKKQPKAKSPSPSSPSSATSSDSELEADTKAKAGSAAVEDAEMAEASKLPLADTGADDTTSSSGSDSSLDESEEDSNEQHEIDTQAAESTTDVMEPPKKPRPHTIDIPETPSSAHKIKDGSLSAASKTDSPRPKSASSVMSLTIKIPPTTPISTAKAQVHPLEALYKRPKPGDADGTTAALGQEKPSFSFFGDGDNEDHVDDDDDDDGKDDSKEGLQLPMTPFTRQDFEHRNMRSAAPTPDTAHHNRSFKFWPPGGEDDIEEEGSDEDADSNHDADGVADGAAANPSGSETGDKAAPASDFQKWFWDNRGDLNRSWKKRRKMAGKEKRYRDNRSRASRAI